MDVDGVDLYEIGWCFTVFVDHDYMFMDPARIVILNRVDMVVTLTL